MYYGVQGFPLHSTCSKFSNYPRVYVRMYPGIQRFTICGVHRRIPCKMRAIPMRSLGNTNSGNTNHPSLSFPVCIPEVCKSGVWNTNMYLTDSSPSLSLLPFGYPRTKSKCITDFLKWPQTAHIFINTVCPQIDFTSFLSTALSAMYTNEQDMHEHVHYYFCGWMAHGTVV